LERRNRRVGLTTFGFGNATRACRSGLGGARPPGRQDEVYLVQGFTTTPEGLDVCDGLGEAAAAPHAHASASNRASRRRPPSRVRHPRHEESEARLPRGPGSRPGKSWTCFVDAQTAEVLETLSNVRTGSSSPASPPDSRYDPDGQTSGAGNGTYYSIPPSVDQGVYDPSQRSWHGRGRPVGLDFLISLPEKAGRRGRRGHRAWDPAGVSAEVKPEGFRHYFQRPSGSSRRRERQGHSGGIHYREETNKGWDNAPGRPWFLLGDGDEVFAPSPAASTSSPRVHPRGHAIPGGPRLPEPERALTSPTPISSRHGGP